MVFSVWYLVPASSRVAGGGFRVWGLRMTSDSTCVCRDTSPIRNSAPLGPYSRNVPRALGWSCGRALFLVSEVFRALQMTSNLTCARKVDVRLPGNSNSHGARPVHLSLSMVILGRGALSYGRGTSEWVWFEFNMI